MYGYVSDQVRLGRQLRLTEEDGNRFEAQTRKGTMKQGELSTFLSLWCWLGGAEAVANQTRETDGEALTVPTDVSDAPVARGAPT
jgi:hypothetical protein